LKLVFPKASKFSKIVHVLTKVVDEAPFVVSSDSVRVSALSEDKTVLVSLLIPSTAFESIEVEEPAAFKVKTKELYRVAKRAGRNDVMELELSREDRLLVVRYIDKKTQVVRTFELPASLEAAAELKEPKVELPVSLEIPAEDYKGVIKDAKLVSDELELVYKDGAVFVRAEEAGKSYEATLREGAPLLSLSSSVSEARARYGVDLLATTTRALTTGSAVVSLRFGTALPLRAHFEVADVGTLVYWVAPRT